METLRVDRHIFLYACGWYKQKNMIQDLKIIISKEHRWDIEDISINGVVNELLHIIEPFLLDINNGCDFKDLMIGIRPDEVWKLGYPENLEYDYNIALVHKIVAMLELVGVWCLGKPDYSILPKRDRVNDTILEK